MNPEESLMPRIVLVVPVLFLAVSAGCVTAGPGLDPAVPVTVDLARDHSGYGIEPHTRLLTPQGPRSIVLTGTSTSCYDVTFWFPTGSFPFAADPTAAEGAIDACTGPQGDSVDVDCSEEHEGCLLTVAVVPGCEVVLHREIFVQLDTGSLRFDVQKATAPSCDDPQPRPYAGTIPIRGVDAVRPALLVPLDNTGIANPRFLNPRQPPAVFPQLPPGQTAPSRNERIEFSNVTFDRILLVTFEAELSETDPDDPCDPQTLPPGVTIECPKDEGSPPRAKVRLQIGPQQSVALPVAWFLRKATGSGKHPFPFTVDFFETVEAPANSKGYLSILPVDPNDLGAEPKTPFDPKFSVSASRVAGTSTDRTCFADATKDRCAWTGDTVERFPVNASVELYDRLGWRGDALAVLSYQRTDLGDGAADSTEAVQYWARVFGSNGTTLQVGRFDFLKPADGIAIAESGEGARFLLTPQFANDRGFSAVVGYLVKRESASGKPDDADRDHDAWTLDVGPIGLPARYLRRISFHAVYGDERLDQVEDAAAEKKEVVSRDYVSYGGELHFGVGDRLYGRLAAYRSERDSRRPEELADGRGEVGLLQASTPLLWTETDGRRQPRTLLSLLVAAGSGDDAATPLDEGYIGESSAFSDGSVFFSMLAGRLRSSDGRVEPSLSNKWIGSLQVTHTGPLLLETISRALQFKEPGTETTTIRLTRVERMRGNGLPRTLGDELALDFKLEKPKGIFWSLGGAYFEADERFVATDLVSDEPWRWAMGVSLKL
jgi:hypothetical protein